MTSKMEFQNEAEVYVKCINYDYDYFYNRYSLFPVYTVGKVYKAIFKSYLTLLPPASYDTYMINDDVNGAWVTFVTEECVDDASKYYEVFDKWFITLEKQRENKLKELDI